MYGQPMPGGGYGGQMMPQGQYPQGMGGMPPGGYMPQMGHMDMAAGGYGG